MEKKIEVRNGTGEVRRSAGDSRHIEGYAAIFNSWSEDLGGFREKIDPHAFDGVIERSDVFCLLNHDKRRGILGRCKRGDMRSLRLEVDEKGLRYEFDAPKTPLGDEILSCIERGEIEASSFGFIVLEDKWERNGDVYERTLTKIDELTDVSPVYNPAYLETSCDLRGLDALKAKEQAEEDRAKAEREEVEFGKYIADLKNEIKYNNEQE